MENRLELVRQALKQYPVADLASIALATGVPVNTLLGIRYKPTNDPRESTLSPLYAYFKNKDAGIAQLVEL